MGVAERTQFTDVNSQAQRVVFDASPYVSNESYRTAPVTPGAVVKVFSTLSLFVAPTDLAALAWLGAAGLQVLGLIDVDETGIDVICERGARLRLPSTPPLCQGLIAVSPAGFDHLERLAPSLRRLGGLRDLTPCLAPQWEREREFILTTELLRLVKEQSAYAVAATRELTALRAMHEDMANAFAELEEKTAAVGLKPIRLVFENPPKGARAVGGSGVQVVSQILPASVAGVSAIEFHLEDAATAKGMTVRLTTLEDGAEQERWDLSRADLKPGWNVLLLKRGVTGAPRTAALEMRASSGLPWLSLGPSLAHRAYRAQASQAVAGPRGALAVRIWAGVPGVAPPQSTSLKPPSRGAKGPRVHEIAIPFQVLRHIALAPGDWRPDFKVISVRPEIGGFLLHPGPGGAITLANLEGSTSPSRAGLARRSLSRASRPTRSSSRWRSPHSRSTRCAN